MNRRALKAWLLEALAEEDLREVACYLENNGSHHIINPLFIALCNTSERVRWNAVWCFGQVVPRMARKEPESARIIMRRFLWSLNDESGGIGWGAPEAMAEIMCNCDLLRHEYLHMLLSYMREDGQELYQEGNYLELPMLQRGLLWGIGRLCQEHRSEMLEKDAAKDIAAYLISTDPVVVGLAIWCLGKLKARFAEEKIARFLEVPDTFQIFLDRSLQTVSLAMLAAESLNTLQKTLDKDCGRS